MDGSWRGFRRWRSMRTQRQLRIHLIIPDFGTRDPALSHRPVGDLNHLTKSQSGRRCPRKPLGVIECAIANALIEH